MHRRSRRIELRNDHKTFVQILRQESDHHGAAEALLELSQGHRVVVENTCRKIVEYIISQIESQERNTEKDYVASIDSKPKPCNNIKISVKIPTKTDVCKFSKTSPSKAVPKDVPGIEEVDQKFDSTQNNIMSGLVKNVPSDTFVNDMDHYEESKCKKTDFKLIKAEMKRRYKHSKKMNNWKKQILTVETKECENQTESLKKDVSIQTDATTEAENECQTNDIKTINAEVQVDIQSKSLGHRGTNNPAKDFEKGSSQIENVKFIIEIENIIFTIVVKPHVDIIRLESRLYDQLHNLVTIICMHLRKEREVEELRESLRELRESGRFYKFTTKEEHEMRMARLDRSTKSFLRQRFACDIPIDDLSTTKSYATPDISQETTFDLPDNPSQNEQNRLSVETLNMDASVEREISENLELIEQIPSNLMAPESTTDNEISLSSCTATVVPQDMKKRGKRQFLDSEELIDELEKIKFESESSNDVISKNSQPRRDSSDNDQSTNSADDGNKNTAGNMF